MKIKLHKIMIFNMCLMLMNIPYFSQSINNLIRLVFEIILLLLIFYYNGFWSGLKESKVYLLLLCIMTFSTLVNCGISTRSINAMVTGCEYVLLFMTVIIISKRIGIQVVVNNIWKFFLVILAITDLCIIFTMGKGIGNDGGVLYYYLIGNKFTVSYYHMISLGLFLSQNKHIKKEEKRKKFFPFYVIYSILICYLVECTTGIIGCMVIGGMFVLSYKKNYIIKLFCKPVAFISVFVGTSFLLVGTDTLLSNLFIQNIIVNVFHRSITLTGRLKMYEITIEAIANQPWWGYGINSTYVEQILSWGNSQNGLLKMLLDYGIVGTSSFLIVCWNAFSKRKGMVSIVSIEYPMMIYLYGMVVCSMVEINLSGIFFLGLALHKAAKNSMINYL